MPTCLKAHIALKPPIEAPIAALPEGSDRAFTEIEISVRATVKAGPNDDRLIGFAFRGLRITTA